MLGPIESIIVAFPGNKFKGEIMPALQELVDKKLIKIIDFVLVVKDSKGKFEAVEMENFDKQTTAFFNKVGIEPSNLITLDDILEVGNTLSNNSSAAMLLFEHVWFKKFRDALMNADGVLIRNDRVPVAIIEEAFEAVEKAGGKRVKSVTPKKK